jgi:hypothetical protein
MNVDGTLPTLEQRIPNFLTRRAAKYLNERADNIEQNVEPDHDMCQPEDAVPLKVGDEETQPIAEYRHLEAHDGESVECGSDMKALNTEVLMIAVMMILKRQIRTNRK